MNFKHRRRIRSKKKGKKLKKKLGIKYFSYVSMKVNFRQTGQPKLFIIKHRDEAGYKKTIISFVSIEIIKLAQVKFHLKLQRTRLAVATTMILLTAQKISDLPTKPTVFEQTPTEQKKVLKKNLSSLS